MADNSKESTYQSLGNGVYRVGALQRSAVTGRYIVGPQSGPPSRPLPPSGATAPSADRRR